MQLHHCYFKPIRIFFVNFNSVKPLNSGHLPVLKNLSVIKRCPLLGGSLWKIATFGTKHFVRYSRHVRYLGCPLLGGFTVFILIWFLPIVSKWLHFVLMWLCTHVIYWVEWKGISSVIRQKGELQNGGSKNTKHTKLSEKQRFLTPWYAHTYGTFFIHWYAHVRKIFDPLSCKCTCASEGVRNIRFFGNFGALCFLVISFDIRLFALLPRSCFQNSHFKLLRYNHDWRKNSNRN